MHDPSTDNRDIWRELFRADALRDVRAIATSIAGMEYDVRILSLGEGGLDVTSGGPGDATGAPPYVIEVLSEDYAELAGALPEIIDEQFDFDEQIEINRSQRQSLTLRVSVIFAIAVVIAMLIAGFAWSQSNEPHHPRPAGVR